jgi:hypothetical protein
VRACCPNQNWEREGPFLSATSLKRWANLHIFTLLRLVEDDTAALRDLGNTPVTSLKLFWFLAERSETHHLRMEKCDSRTLGIFIVGGHQKRVDKLTL